MVGEIHALFLIGVASTSKGGAGGGVSRTPSLSPGWEERGGWGLAHPIPETLPEHKQQCPPDLSPPALLWTSAMTERHKSWSQRRCGGHGSALPPLVGHTAPVVTSPTICSLRRESPEGKPAAELLPMAMLWKEVVVTRWHWESDTVDYLRTISKWLAVIRSRWQWDSSITVIYTEKINKCYMPLATGMDGD